MKVCTEMKETRMTEKVKLIARTQIVDPDLLKELKNSSPEELIMYCARVSAPQNQTSGKPGLLKYCTREGHWSIFEMCNMVLEIETSRAISAQILRHRSFSFQEFSQRYAKVQGMKVYPARSQDHKNRQNSNDDMSEDDKEWFDITQKALQEDAQTLYDQALNSGIAKEQARFLLPMASTTRLYMQGNIRSWIHYIDLRCGNGTQKEHQDIAKQAKAIFIKEYPVISDALGWTND